jgi:hypothetical protein
VHATPSLLEMGDLPQPLHQKDAYGCFITLFKSSFNLITTQVSCQVDLKINQRKKNKAKDKAASQSDPMIKPPPTPAEEIPCYRLQSVAPILHDIPLLLGLEIRPRTDPVNNHRENLQERLFCRFVKNSIIAHIPNSPKNSADSHPNLNQILLGNTA